MSLLTHQTRWILWSPSKSDPEERHIYDVAFSLLCLESKGVDPKDIILIIDGGGSEFIKERIRIASRNDYTIYKTENLFEIFDNTNSYKNLVLIVTGHGSVDGILAQSFIKPYPLIHRIKTITNLKCGIVILGQCYAGIFNYINAQAVYPRREKLLIRLIRMAQYKFFKNNIHPNILQECPVVIIGATNLHESISISIKEEFLDSLPIQWVANTFLAMFFKWIKEPIDVDGDGRFTLMDAYKYAGSKSNDVNKQNKKDDFFKPFLELQKLSEIVLLPKTPDIVAEIKSLEEQINKTIYMRFVHQESWILNSIPAQSIEF